MVSSTHASLLERLRDWDDEAAWRRFCAGYGDLIVRYALARGLQVADAEDVRQQVLGDLSKALRTFAYDPARGRFRDYLGRATRNAVARHVRRHVPDSRVPGEGGTVADPLHELWGREWADHHYREALRRLRRTHDPRSLAIFEALVAGSSTRDVARRFDVTEPVVRKVKQRVKDRLRELIAGQVAEEDRHG